MDTSAQVGSLEEMKANVLCTGPMHVNSFAYMEALVHFEIAAQCGL